MQSEHGRCHRCRHVFLLRVLPQLYLPCTLSSFKVKQKCPTMLAALYLHGLLLVGLLALYNRWLDDTLTADLCFVALLVELISAVLAVRFFSVSDTVFFAEIGSLHPMLSLVGELRLVLCFDELSAFFLGILVVALLVCFCFLTEYFEYDAGAGSIIWLSAFFSQAALLFFSAWDLLLILFLWEVISLISFFLVQHWSFRIATYKAGLKVFSFSQVGDLPLFVFIFLVISHFGSTDLSEILSQLPLALFEYLFLGSFLLSLNESLAFFLSFAVFLKAAQFFFYPWLLDAMEAPVPISAQLHSSTLVVIGFYLFFRFQLLFFLSPGVSFLFLFFGVVTVVGASILGFFQDDGKRLLACSTASQLGYVVVCLGLNLYSEALLLLAFCCTNKAFTFVWFGALMRRYAGLSDLRSIGGCTSLNWLEHAGLAVSILNFTIFPGAFSWHVKSLLLGGQTLSATPVAFLGLEVLQLTWFFSSLYLWALYLSLFLRPQRGSIATAALGVSKTTSAHSRYTAALVLRAAYYHRAVLSLSARFTVSDLSKLFFMAVSFVKPGRSVFFLIVMLLAQFALSWFTGGWFLTSVDTGWALNFLLDNVSYF